MCDEGLIELADDSHKVKQAKERELVELVVDTLAGLTNQCLLFLNQRLKFFQKPENPWNHC